MDIENKIKELKSERNALYEKAKAIQEEINLLKIKAKKLHFKIGDYICINEKTIKTYILVEDIKEIVSGIRIYGYSARIDLDNNKCVYVSLSSNDFDTVVYSDDFDSITVISENEFNSVIDNTLDDFRTNISKKVEVLKKEKI